MNRRSQFLEVLGIPTEWVPRRMPDPAGVPEAVDVAAAEAQLGAMAQATVDAPVGAVKVAGLVETAEAFDADSLADAAEAADAVAMVEAFAPVEQEARPASREVSQPPSDSPSDFQSDTSPLRKAPHPDQDARHAAIAAMDWPALESSVAGCTACGLCTTRTQTVFGVGDAQAEWMLVGEAPGENEDLQGEPFVGQAGKLLDNMLGALGLARGRNVFIANVLKCRPPGNRNPEPDEVAQCEPYLRRQIALIKPKVIVVLGRFAAQSLLRSTTPIGKLRGTVHAYEGIPVVVTYHPAYLLRTLTDKARAWEDLCLAREVHDRAGAQA